MTDYKRHQIKVTRLKYIDVAKGIAIILVIVGHCFGYIQGRSPGIVDNIIVEFIDSFHMPLFFVIGGLTYQRNDIRKLLLAKFSSLVIPWFVWLSVNFIVGLILSLFLKAGMINEELHGRLIYIFCLRGLWFVQGYLIVSILYRIIDQKLRNKYVFHGLAAVFLVLGLFISKNYSNLLPPYYLHALIGIFFYHFGTILKKYFVNHKNMPIVFATVGVLSLVCVILFTIITHNNVLMYLNDYGNSYYFVVTAVLGSVGVILISKWIDSCRVLEAFGKRSLSIMGVQFIAYLFTAFIFEKLKFLSQYHLFPYNLLFVLVSILLSYAAGYYLYRFFPLFSGSYRFGNDFMDEEE